MWALIFDLLAAFTGEIVPVVLIRKFIYQQFAGGMEFVGGENCIMKCEIHCALNSMRKTNRLILSTRESMKIQVRYFQLAAS